MAMQNSIPWILFLYKSYQNAALSHGSPIEINEVAKFEWSAWRFQSYISDSQKNGLHLFEKYFMIRWIVYKLPSAIFLRER